MRTTRLLAAVLTAALAAPVLAQDRVPEALTRRDQLLGWEAVGRIDLGGKGFCTGALIATDLVLTAAHCVQGRDGRPVSAGSITFEAALVDGVALATSRVARVVADPGFRPDRPLDIDNLRHDVALLELAQPIPAALAAPFTVKAPGARGTDVSVVSYARGRESSPSWQRTCRLLDRQGGVLAVDCDVTFGSSGAPVLERGSGRPAIVSLISGGTRNGSSVLAFGMELPAAIDRLKAMLRRGEVLSRAEEAPSRDAARRIGPGASGGNRDIGARFLRP